MYVFVQDCLVSTTVNQIITEALEKNTNESLIKTNEPRLLPKEEEWNKKDNEKEMINAIKMKNDSRSYGMRNYFES